jgi:DNA-binding NarL/FixJ family response regulator
MTVKRALKDLKIPNQLIRVGNGEDALEYLNSKDNMEPCVILLDLNMPKMNGFEFLNIIKADEKLKNIPVVVLTTSGTEQDITDSYKLGVAGYMVKSADYEKSVETIDNIASNWISIESPSIGSK